MHQRKKKMWLQRRRRGEPAKRRREVASLSQKGTAKWRVGLPPII
jgi:hypothetical protein